MNSPIPRQTLERLPRYLRHLERAKEGGQVRTSVRLLSRELGLDPARVEEDLAPLGIKEKPTIDAVIRAIEHFLSWDNTQDAFLVGEGPLEAALEEYEGFPQFGIRIAASFGEGRFPLENLPSLARRMHIQLGIIAVDADHAQEAADQMKAGGIRVILNFAPVAVHAEGCLVQNENLAAGLAWLSRRVGIN